MMGSSRCVTREVLKERLQLPAPISMLEQTPAGCISPTYKDLTPQSMQVMKSLAEGPVHPPAGAPAAA